MCKDSIQLSNKSTLEYGHVEHNPVSKALSSGLYYRNPNGKLEWKKILEKNIITMGLGSVVEMTSNKFAGISMSCTGCEYPTMKPYVFAVDTFGNLVLDLYLDTMSSEFH